MHPSAEQLQAFLNGQLSAVELRQVESHVESCDHCCEVLQSIPPGSIGDKLRMVETWAGVAETLPYNDMQGDREAETGVPAELLDHSRYRIVKQLGAGGMGVVYQAQHRVMNRMVALKVINPKFVSNSDWLKRFQLEVTCAASLNHRNIVTAHDAEQAGRLHFLVMEFIDGVSLADLVKKRGSLSTLHACNYAMQAANGLQHAFERGMVHRDIKPHNLMRTRNGTVKILDFGLARLQQDDPDADSGLTGQGARLGTPDYIAPEQARDPRQADIRADIYSLGCTLYYMLSGRVPFEDGTPNEKIIAHSEHHPPPLDAVCEGLRPEVVAIVEQMMAKDPDDRFQSPAEAVEALKPFGKPDAAPLDPTDAHAETMVTAATVATTPVYDLLASPDLPAASVAPGYGSSPPASSSPRRTTPEWWNVLRRRKFAVAIAAVLLFGGIWFLSWFFREPTWKDLIPLCKRKHMEAAQGSWSKENGELLVSGDTATWIALPYRPPRQFDLEVEVSRTRGKDSIAIFFAVGDGRASYEVDAWLTHLGGIQLIDGESLKTNSTRVENIKLRNNQRYTMLVRMRKSGVTVFLNGKQLATYRGDGSRLQVGQIWNVADSMKLGVGCYDGDATFHRIRILPVR